MQRVVKNDADLKLLTVYLEQRKRPFTVDITEGRDRSTEQNKLAFQWYREIAEQAGEDREDVRALCKLRHGLPILMASSEAFRDLCRRRIKPLSHAERIEVIRDFDIPITRLMSVTQMGEYLDSVFKAHTEFGIALTVPPDRFAYSPREEKAA